jgi:hypothetical protein
MTRVSIKPSKLKTKKFTATFFNDKGEKIKTTHFGAKGMSDYTIHKDPKRKKRYLDRHRKNENWEDFMTAGSLSRYVLWEKPNLQKSISFYKKRFNLS